MIQKRCVIVTRLLIGTFLLGCFTLPLSAQQNSSSKIKSGTIIWQPYIEGNFRGGGLIERGELDLFVPLSWSDTSLLFADLRGSIGDIRNYEGNWALAARHLTDKEWILGIWSSYDLRQSPTGNNFDQISFGLEVMDVNWDFRMNGYVPTTLAAQPASAQALLSGGNIIVRSNQERAYRGLDGEIGRLLWFNDPYEHHWRNGWLASLDVELRAFVGGFYFDNPAAGFGEITGPRARAELRLYDLAILGEGSRLTFEAITQHDGLRGTQFIGAVFVRVPFGQRSSRRLLPIKRRMVDRIVRDIDVVASQGPTTVEPARFAQTGQLTSAVLLVDGNTPNPESVIESAGVDSVVIVDGSNGIVDLPGTVNMPVGQTILGGGAPLQVVGDQSGIPATFIAPGTRGTLNAVGFDAISTANNVGLVGLDITTSGIFANGIDINSNTNVLIRNVAIMTSNDSGVGIQSSGTSQFTLEKSMIVTSGDFAGGIFSYDSSQFTVNNSTIMTSGLSSFGISHDAVGSVTLNNSTIVTSGTDADAISREGGGGSFTMNGGRITTTGTGANGIFATTFSTGNTMTFLLSGVTINTADDSIYLETDPFFGGTINATITGNTVTAGAGFDEISVNSSSTICLNASGNMLDGGSGSISLDSFAIIDVTQDAAGAGMNGIDVLNGLSPSNIFTSGTINYGAAACPLP